MAPGSSVRAFNYLLGETGVSFFGTKVLVSRYERDFPRSRRPYGRAAGREAGRSATGSGRSSRATLVRAGGRPA